MYIKASLIDSHVIGSEVRERTKTSASLRKLHERAALALHTAAEPAVRSAVKILVS